MSNVCGSILCNVDDDVRGGPPTPQQQGAPPHTHHCWPLIRVTAFDFHYVIVLRVAINHYLLHFQFVLRPTTCALRHAYGFNMRMRSQTLYFSHVFLCFGYAFLIFSIQVLLTAFAHIKGQQWCVCGGAPCSCAVGGPPRTSSSCGAKWYFQALFCVCFKALFLIFGLLS